MRGVSIWAPIVAVGGSVAALGQKRDECSVSFVTTILVPTTVYVTVPGPLTSPSSSISASSRTNSEVGTTAASSSSNAVSSVSSPTSEVISSVTSSRTGSATRASSSGSGTASLSVTLSTSSSVIDEPSTTAITSGTSSSVSEPITTPIKDPLTSASTISGTISSSATGNVPGSPTIKPPGPPSPPPAFRGYKNAIYFTSWGTSGNNSYQPQELPVSELTHILYAFADIDANGTVKSSDAFADVGKRYANDDPHNRTLGRNNAYGAVKQLYLHKKWNRNLKTLLSIGGFDFSPKFIPVAADEGRRRVFASSAVKMMADYGFDGIDLDWEYPADAEQAQHFILLLKACREELDKFSFQHRLAYRFLLTAASPAGPVNSHKLDLAGMDPYVDIWNLMAYDYTGSWDNTTGHQSNLYRSPRRPSATKLSTDDAVRYYEAAGIQPHKILLGLPTYGRSFESTSGLGQAYMGVGVEGGGVLLYKTLPRPGAQELWDDEAKASWSYDNKTRELVSYDTPRSTLYKARYVRRKKLGGAFFWEATGDRAGAASLVNTMSKTLGWLDESPNHLWYPMSQYDNIRWGMPGA
ncbi:Chitinase 1 [Apiospora arundinis]|uniref:chitinase n=1 Tax=Apiospora arundinis TaxID=335852 RepID=A0ABR2J5R4_9PEZI